jgi:hypothetical protein
LVCREFIFPCGDVEGRAASPAKALQDRSNFVTLGHAYGSRILDWSPQQNIEAILRCVTQG